MAEELSAADRSSLAAEQGPVSMAVGGLMRFASAAALEHGALLRRVQDRLHLIPRYRQRLATPAPGGLANPVWVDDDHFDLDWHVRRASLPSPGGEAELEALVGTEMARRLDRSRPLWELTVVDGLADGSGALLAKMHHALVDGVAAVDIGTVLLDPTPEPLDLPPAGEWSPQRYDRTRHLAKLSVSPARRAQRWLVDAARQAADPLDLAGDLGRATELVTQLARTRPSAPMTPLNEPIGPNRRFALHREDLAPLKAAAKAHGATVNDAILTVVAGTLAEVLPGLPARPVALVPVSVRREGEQGGNRISTVLVDLPTELDDPLERLLAVHEAMQDLKASAAVRAGALLVGASGFAPPLVSSTLARATSGVRAFNLVVSNVPGPQQPFFLHGERLVAVHPAVPLNPVTAGLSVGVLSYDGSVCFGVLADRDLRPSAAEVRSALRRAVPALLAAAAG